LSIGPPRTPLVRASIVVVLATLAIYGQLAGHEFIAYDTASYLTHNPEVLRGLTWEGVRWAFTTFYAANWHPLTWLSHMLDVELFGLRPGPHHLVNAAFHCANACLVVLVLARLTGDVVRSAAVALLFALHPLHVESVAWIVERKDVLSGFFGLLCLWFWIDFARTARAPAYAAALLCFAAGLMSKPMLVTWPFVLLLLDVWPLERTSLGARRLAVEKLPFLVLAASSSVVTFVAQHSGGAVQSLASYPLSVRVANAIDAYGGYLAKTFWPAGLTFYYPHTGAELGAPRTIACAVGIAAITWIAIARVQRAPWLLVGWLFFLGTLVPVIGIVQVGEQAMADRYTYLPLLGVFVALVWTAGEWARAHERFRRAVVGAAAIACAALGWLAWRQAGRWRDTETLCAHALAVDPQNHIAHDLLGLVLVERGELDAALVELREAIRIEPKDVGALVNLAAVYTRQGRLADAEDAYRGAIALSPTLTEVRFSLAAMLREEHRPAEALEQIDAILSLRPEAADMLYTRGVLLLELGRDRDARAAFERSLAIRPGDVAPRIGLARLAERAGDLDAAERELRRAVSDAPADPAPRRELDRLLEARSK
jgi:tetratricopeptide (TPR) repeat protein